MSIKHKQIRKKYRKRKEASAFAFATMAAVVVFCFYFRRFDVYHFKKTLRSKKAAKTGKDFDFFKKLMFGQLNEDKSDRDDN